MIEDVLLVLVFIIIMLIISGVVTKFNSLPIDIFNTATGLLMAFVFTKDAILLDSSTQISEGFRIIEVSALKVFSIITQLAFGALILSSFKAFDKTKLQYNPKEKLIKLFGYLIPMTLSFLSLYLWASFYIHRRDIIKPIKSDIPDLYQIWNNYIEIQYFNISFIIIALIIILVFSIFYTDYRLKTENITIN